MNVHSTMRVKVEEYLNDRHRAGFALKIEAGQLGRFARFVDDSGYRGSLTIELASRWARANRHGRPLTAARRIEVLRGLARYCQMFDPATEIPPARLFGPAHRRLTPHIYTERKIQALVVSAAKLFPPGGLRGAACATIFGLIAATGLRVSEATGLKRADVDGRHHLLHIQRSKFGKSRLVPMHPTVTYALQRYVRRRDQDPLPATADAFFVFDHGRVASTGNVQYAFRQLRQELGWRARGGHPAPRIHDLRHTFVSRRLERWYGEGIDVERYLLALSTYVGHAKVTDTYWYLTATPRLMAIAARRLAPPRTGDVS